MKLYYLLAGASAAIAAPVLAQETTDEKVAEAAIEAADAAAEAADAATEAAQEAADVANMAAAQAELPMRQIILPPNTEIMVTPVEDFTTKKTKEGATFEIKTVFDVMQDGVIVIPKNTYGMAEMTWRTGKGMFGKSAKMEVTFRSLDLGNGRTLPLTGKHRQEGRGNTGATAGAVVAAGLIGGMFVTGRSAVIVAGQHVQARSAEAMTFEVAADAPKQIYATPEAVETAEPVVAAAEGDGTSADGIVTEEAETADQVE